MRTSGRTSADSVPSAAATITVSSVAAIETMTWLMQRIERTGEFVDLAQHARFFLRWRAIRPDRSAHTANAIRSRRAHDRRPASPDCAIARALCAAVSNCGKTISSEYAKPVFSPLIARTPTPCSIECVAVLDDAVFEHPRLAARMLEIQIGRVDGRTHQLREDAVEIAAGKSAGLQQLPLGQGKKGHRWITALRRELKW